MPMHTPPIERWVTLQGTDAVSIRNLGGLYGVVRGFSDVEALTYCPAFALLTFAAICDELADRVDLFFTPREITENALNEAIEIRAADLGDAARLRAEAADARHDARTIERLSV